MKINEIIFVILIFYLLKILVFFYQTESNFIKIFDVGQGDAIYIKYERISLLVDLGGNYESTYNVFKSYFPYFCHVNYVFITHPHFDHLGGLSRFEEICQIDTYIFNDIDYDSQAYAQIYDFIDENKRLKTYNGDVFKTKDLYLETLWPTRKFLHTFKNVNDTSIAQFLDVNDFEVLLLGDVEHEALSRINFNKVLHLVDGRLDILKVSHHGSKTGLSKELIKKFRPIYCIISVGEENKFGHPHREVVDYLESQDCKVLRTDQEGTITFYIK